MATVGDHSGSFAICREQAYRYSLLVQQHSNKGSRQHVRSSESVRRPAATVEMAGWRLGTLRAQRDTAVPVDVVRVQEGLSPYRVLECDAAVPVLVKG